MRKGLREGIWIFELQKYGYGGDTLVSKIEYKNNMPNGNYFLYSNNVLLSSGKHKDGGKHREWKTFYINNGNVLEKGVYENGLKQGSWIEYYTNGQIKNKINFTDGQKDGIKTWYYPHGQVQKVILYKRNHSVKAVVREGVSLNTPELCMEIISSYDEKGEPLFIGTLKNGNGTIHHFNAFDLYGNQFSHSEKFKNGILVKTHHNRVLLDRDLKRLKKK